MEWVALEEKQKRKEQSMGKSSNILLCHYTAREKTAMKYTHLSAILQVNEG